MNKHRISTNIGKDQFVKVELIQEMDLLEILSNDKNLTFSKFPIFINMEKKFEDRINCENISCIYGIKNIITNKLYIGSTINLKKRIIDHYNLLNTKKHSNTKLLHSWLKYGEKNFVFFIIKENVLPKNLIKEEQYFIDKYDVVTNGYNILKIAGSSLGQKWTEESKKNYSLFKKTLNLGTPIIQYNLDGVLIKEYKNIRIAAEENDIKNPSNIGLVCRKERKTASGFIWEYKEKEKQEKYGFKKYIKNIIKCPHCNNTNTKKAGFYNLKDKKEQMYKCNDCSRRFNIKTNKPNAWNVNVERNKKIIDMNSENKDIKYISNYFNISEITVNRILKKNLNNE